jgi:hypothetical protein
VSRLYLEETFQFRPVVSVPDSSPADLLATLYLNRHIITHGSATICGQLIGMPFDQYVYPPYDTPLLEAYGARFEALYVVLHPFIRMPEEFSWRSTRRYPDDAQILSHGAGCSWSEVAGQTGMGACARLNQALLTSIGAIDDYLCDYPARDKLRQFLQSSSVWMPVEGRFEPVLHDDFLHAFDAAGHNRLIYVPEFPLNDPIQPLPIAGLRDRTLPFPSCGTIVAPDQSFLFTVDWDSFFTLFYGPRGFIERVVRDRSIEGFFAAPTTEHAWFNYSFGCATVTLSPEHWPA